MLAEGRGGFFPPHDPAAITATLRPLLADPALRANYAARARAYGATLHWPLIGQQYLDTLAEVALPVRPFPIGVRRGTTNNANEANTTATGATPCQN